MLTQDQMQNKVQISRLILASFQAKPVDVFQRLVSQDETWVQPFDPESKRQSMHQKTANFLPPTQFKQMAAVGMATASAFGVVSVYLWFSTCKMDKQLLSSITHQN